MISENYQKTLKQGTYEKITGTIANGVLIAALAVSPYLGKNVVCPSLDKIYNIGNGITHRIDSKVNPLSITDISDKINSKMMYERFNSETQNNKQNKYSSGSIDNEPVKLANYR